MCQMSPEPIKEMLQQGRVYEVGGAVRDRLLAVAHLKDRDYLVTGIPLDKLTGLLSRHGRVDMVGRSFGVIKFTEFRDGVPYTFDVALPRREHSTGVGHKDFAVQFDPQMPVETDLRRRDFTINAMAWALDTSDLVDPLGGQRDLRDRCIRMTAPDSFPDDPLRMLRAIQFAARFEFTIEPVTLQAMIKHAPLIRSVSAERVTEEFTKLLVLSRTPSIGFRLMNETGLLEHLLPELAACVGVDQPGGYHKYDVFEHTIRTVDACRPELRLRLAALFHDINKPQAKRVVDDGATFYGHEVHGARTSQVVMERLRYSRELIEQVAVLVERHMFTTDVTDKGLRRLVKRVGQDLIFDLLDLRRADVVAQGMGGKTDDVDLFEQQIRDELQKKPPFGLSDLAIKGTDLMTMFNIPPGPEVGRLLNALLEQVLDHPEDNTRERLETHARRLFVQQSDDLKNLNT